MAIALALGPLIVMVSVSAANIIHTSFQLYYAYAPTFLDFSSLVLFVGQSPAGYHEKLIVLYLWLFKANTFTTLAYINPILDR